MTMAVGLIRRQRGEDRARHGRDQRRQGRIARQQRHGEPDQRRGERCRPHQHDQDAERRRRPLAAAKAEPERKHVADHRAAGGGERRLRAPPCADDDRRGPLRHVEQQGQRGEAFAAGAQHVGRADVARADPADVAMAAEPAQQQPERDRAQEVADDGGGEHDHRDLPLRNPLPPPGGEGRVRGAVSELAAGAPLTPTLSPQWGAREEAWGDARGRSARSPLAPERWCGRRPRCA